MQTSRHRKSFVAFAPVTSVLFVKVCLQNIVSVFSQSAIQVCSFVPYLQNILLNSLRSQASCVPVNQAQHTAASRLGRADARRCGQR